MKLLNSQPSFFAAALMFGVLVAILMPYRVNPIPNFLPEAFALGAVFIAAVILNCQRGFSRVAYFGSSTACAIALSAWIWISIPLTNPSYPDTLLLTIASLLGAAVATSAALVIRKVGQSDGAIRSFAILWILASFGTAALQLVQFISPEHLEIWLVPRPLHMQPFGNLAQRNHAACVHALALLSLGYLFYKENHSFKLVLTLLALLAMTGIVGSGSRMGSILGAGAAIGFVVMADRDRSGARLGKFFVLGVCALLAYTAIYLTLNRVLFSLEPAQAFHSAATRWVTYGNLPREVLNQLAIEVFLTHPITGAGWGSFSAQSLMRVDDVLLPQFANNSHNLISQLAAETGIVGLSIVVIPIILILVSVLKTPFELGRCYLFLICALLLIYSMTEFPLWHTFFLLPFAFALGMIDPYVKSIVLSKTLRAMTLIFYVVSTIATFHAAATYIDISQMVQQVFRPGDASPDLRKYVSSRLQAPGFSPQTELLAFGLMGVNSEKLAEKIKVGERVVKQHIDFQLLSKYSALLALDGQVDAAVGSLTAACRFYPEKCWQIVPELERLSKLDQKYFAPVLEKFVRTVSEDARRKDG